jgi:hypothetical protein
MIRNRAENFNDDREALELRAASINRGKWVYMIVREALKAGMSWPDIREAIRAAGVYKGYHEFPRTTDMREFARGFATTELTKLNDGRIPILTDREFVWEVHYCPMVEGWLQYTDDAEFIAELCDACMEIDRGAMESYGWEFELGETIGKGDGKCVMRMRKKS